MLLNWDWVIPHTQYLLSSVALKNKYACVVIQGRLSIKGFTRLKLRHFINYELIIYTMVRKRTGCLTGWSLTGCKYRSKVNHCTVRDWKLDYMEYYINIPEILQKDGK